MLEHKQSNLQHKRTTPQKVLSPQNSTKQHKNKPQRHRVTSNCPNCLAKFQATSTEVTLWLGFLSLTNSVMKKIHLPLLMQILGKNGNEHSLRCSEPHCNEISSFSQVPGGDGRANPLLLSQFVKPIALFPEDSLHSCTRGQQTPDGVTSLKVLLSRNLFYSFWHLCFHQQTEGKVSVGFSSETKKLQLYFSWACNLYSRRVVKQSSVAGISLAPSMCLCWSMPGIISPLQLPS